MSIDAEAGHREAGVEPTELELVFDASDFEEFFTREYPRLVVLLTAVTGRRGVAEEIAQEALIRAHQRWRRVSRYERPTAWVRRVALNLASNQRARQRTEDRTLRRLGDQRTSEGPDDGDDGFWALVRQLPDRQGAAVALYYLEDRPVAEVAAILGCAEGTAKAHLHKGRASLARLLDHPEAPDGA
ncbi:SigE family RNA polymerase sigma factor [soil metagenome]